MGARFERIIHAQHTQYTSFYTPQHFTNTRPRTKSIMICSRSLICAAGLILVIQGTLAMQKEGGPPKDDATILRMIQHSHGHMDNDESLVDRVVDRANAATMERHPEDHGDYHMTPINVPENEDSDKRCIRQVLTPGQTHTDGVYTSEVTGACSEGHRLTTDEDFAPVDLKKMLNAIAKKAIMMAMLRQFASVPQMMTLPQDATISQAIDHVANEYFKKKGTEQNPERVQHLDRSCDHPCKATAMIRTPSLSGRIEGVIRGNAHHGLIEVESFPAPLSPRSSAARIKKEQASLDRCSHSHEEMQAPEADDAATPEMPKAGTR